MSLALTQATYHATRSETESHLISPTLSWKSIQVDNPSIWNQSKLKNIPSRTNHQARSINVKECYDLGGVDGWSRLGTHWSNFD